jgi:hypothetical protein
VTVAIPWDLWDRLRAVDIDRDIWWDEGDDRDEAGSDPSASATNEKGGTAVKAIHAIWKNGQIVPTQPVDWPEGTALAVEPIEEPLETNSEGDLLGDDPESIARWLDWLDSLEPLHFTPEEEAALQAAQQRNSW